MTIKPVNYNLTFEPDLEKFIFEGKEIIAFELKEKTKRIVLDAVDLEIKGCWLTLSFPQKQESIKWIPDQVRNDKKKEKVFLNFSQELKPGKYRLFIEFQGVLNDKLAGFYRCKYIVEGKAKYLATTQFEAADARRAFPCIDHPSYKATFDISLIVDKKLTAISNALPISNRHSRKRSQVPDDSWRIDSRIVVSNNDSGQVFRQVFDREAQTESAQDTEQSRSAGMTMLKDKKLVIFETTPLMSTYLLYLGIGEFEFLEDKYKDILLRVVTTPGKKQYGKFALECAKNSLEYFEEYFDYLYPLKKLDLIAVPEFATGAMENWGAITFRENALLFYPDKSSKATMQRIAEVVAHEIAHQWFGNLVTMKWWDDLWLNESFATYMAYKVTDYHWPEWKVWDQYITDTVFEGMTLDSLKSSHPIKVTVKNTSELEELFDEIAYEKGGSILRMLDLYLRGTDFRDGLRKYIKAYQYNNAEAKDLWRTLENISAKPILDMMQKYVTQVGFPMIKIELKNNIISLRQNRFLFDEEPSGMKQLWFIPYHLDDARHQDGIFLLENKVKEIKMVKEMNYLNINKNYLSFFITEYSEDLLENLGKNLAGLKNSEKLGLIHDLFALILAGKIDLQNLYHFIDSFFIKEESSILLHYIISKLTGIFLLMRDETSKKLAIKYSKRALELVGYEPENNENILDSYLRAAALSSLTLFEDKEVASFVNKKFLRYLENEKSLHPDLRAIVYSSSVWFNESNHRIIKNLYKTSLVQEEKAKFLMALGNSKNKKLIKETLEYSFQQDVPFAFLPYIVSSTARNPKAKEIVLDWLLRNWSLLVKRSGGMANMLLRRILQSIIPICGIRKEMKVENFLETNKIKGLERTIKQVLEQLKINSRLVRKYKN